MSAELSSIINTMRSKADDLRVKLAEMDAGIAALQKIQGGAAAASTRRKGRKANGNGAGGYVNENSAEVKDAKLQSFMS